MYQRPFVSFIEACSLDTDACSTATSTRGSRPMRLPSEIACATPHASISEARGLGTRENICSLVIPGEAIATPCEVHSTPIDRGDEHSRQLTMHLDDHPVGSIDARDWSYQLPLDIIPTRLRSSAWVVAVAAPRPRPSPARYACGEATGADRCTRRSLAPGITAWRDPRTAEYTDIQR